MAKSCGSCGAGFSGDGAAEALATHVEDFHPPRPADSPVPARPPRGTAAAASGDVASLRETITALGERITALEALGPDGTVAELSNRVAALEALETRITALEEADSSEPVKTDAAPATEGDAGADPKTPAKLGAKASG